MLCNTFGKMKEISRDDMYNRDKLNVQALYFAVGESVCHI